MESSVFVSYNDTHIPTFYDMAGWWDDDDTDGDDDDNTQANIRTYGKFCSLFEEELAKVDQQLVDITEVIKIMIQIQIQNIKIQIQEKRREEASVRILSKISSFIDRQKLGELVNQEDWS